MCLALAGFCLRTDLAGVSGWVRVLSLHEKAYPRLLHLCHSCALDVERLTACWVRLVLSLLTPVKAAGMTVWVGDGLKAPKEGRKMPAVKKLHQASANNSKPEYIFGHSFQAIGLLVTHTLGAVFAVPISSRIHEGAVFSNRDRRTLLDKFVQLFLPLAAAAPGPSLLVADAYYASAKVIRPLLRQGHHLLTRVKAAAVAYELPPARPPGQRGRPRRYGAKVPLKSLWERTAAFVSAPSPVYGERDVTIRYAVHDLLWRPAGVFVRFILLDHPVRGRLILMSTCLQLQALDILRLYGLRFKIEVSFRQAIHTLGTYAYHFWMKLMKPHPHTSGNQYLHRTDQPYRDGVRRKLTAYHRYVQLGCVAQGLLQYLALAYGPRVWAQFKGWLRTMNPHHAPSEAVVAQALRDSLPDFLLTAPPDHDLKKFLLDHIDSQRCSPLLMAA
jgi:DDE superfamily endonuclease